MVDAIQVLWSPAAISMPSLGSRAFVDTTDGDTPNVSMPVRMLSVDTPEVTADTPEGARQVDVKFTQLAEWIEQGKAPISPALAEHLGPKLATRSAGTLQFEQGKKASAFADGNIRTRLARPGKPDRRIFIRSAEPYFDDNGRLLAYIAPNFTAAERATLPREQRSTFNLDLVAAGWAAPFVIYPAIPGELDLPLLLTATEKAMSDAATTENIWSEPSTLLAYEYRMMEKLHTVTVKIIDGEGVAPAERFSWRERYCADMRSRILHGSEDYMAIPPQYRLWFWPRDVQRAIGDLNLVPSKKLVNAE